MTSSVCSNLLLESSSLLVSGVKLLALAGTASKFPFPWSHWSWGWANMSNRTWTFSCAFDETEFHRSNALYYTKKQGRLFAFASSKFPHPMEIFLHRTKQWWNRIWARNDCLVTGRVVILEKSENNLNCCQKTDIKLFIFDWSLPVSHFEQMREHVSINSQHNSGFVVRDSFQEGSRVWTSRNESSVQHWSVYRNCIPHIMNRINVY